MTEVIVGIVVPLMMAIIVNVIMVLCIIVCYKLQYYNAVRTLCGKVVRYRKPQSRGSISNTRSQTQSAAELTASMEYGLDKIEDTSNPQMKRVSTISQQNEAYGVISQLSRDKTVKQDNVAYGMTTNIMENKSASKTEPDTGQAGDVEYEYVHMRFQK